MRLRITIPWKIGFGFGLFMLIVAIVFTLTRSTLQQNKQLNAKVQEVYTPSLEAIEDLQESVAYSRVLIKHWALVQSRPDEKERRELATIMDQTIPYQQLVIDSIGESWDKRAIEIKDSLYIELDRLDIIYGQIRSALSSFEAYDDPIIVMEVNYQFLEGASLDQINTALDKNMAALQQEIRSNAIEVNQQIDALGDRLGLIVGNLAIFVLIAGLLIAIFVSRSITKPISELKRTLLYLGKGIYPKKNIRVSDDEIGDMAFAVNRLTDGLVKTREFSNQVGQGNFGASYLPLSEDDELGHALLKMRDDLAENERVLEQKVIERTNEVVQKKEEIERQKEKVTELYKDLTDSINYAKRIQQAILPPESDILEIFPESFVFYRPRNIVSGDFYWFKMAGNKKMFAAVDCTGHGVPGAFMSLVGYNVLNQVTKVFTQPAQVLNNLNRLSAETLRANGLGDDNLTDGMDLALVSIDENKDLLQYAGAHNPLFIIRGEEFIQIQPDKMAIGAFEYGDFNYTNHEFELKDGDMIYAFSDGYADQFGGPKNKKFMKKRLRELFIEISSIEDLSKQKSVLTERFFEWKMSYDQVDDILIIGVRYRTLSGS